MADFNSPLTPNTSSDRPNLTTSALPHRDKSGRSLPDGAVAGIAISIIFFVLGIVTTGFCFYRRRNFKHLPQAGWVWSCFPWRREESIAELESNPKIQQLPSFRSDLRYELQEKRSSRCCGAARPDPPRSPIELEGDHFCECRRPSSCSDQIKLPHIGFLLRHSDSEK